jgi:hypothetical protein
MSFQISKMVGQSMAFRSFSHNDPNINASKDLIFILRFWAIFHLIRFVCNHNSCSILE